MVIVDTECLTLEASNQLHDWFMLPTIEELRKTSALTRLSRMENTKSSHSESRQLTQTALPILAQYNIPSLYICQTFGQVYCMHKSAYIHNASVPVFPDFFISSGRF